MKRFYLIFLLLFVGVVISQTVQARMMSVAGGRVNLRSGPGTKYTVRWEYGNGFPVRILARKGSWYKVIDFEKATGWIEKGLLSSRPHFIVKRKRVNIRSGPSAKYKLLGQANYGVVFSTLTRKKGWAKVKHANGLVGWIRRDLLWGW